MNPYLRTTVEKKAPDLFSGANVQPVLSWWISNEGRNPIVVEGAGFTRNAVCKGTKAVVRPGDVPLWSERPRRLAKDPRIDEASGIDALSDCRHREAVAISAYLKRLSCVCAFVPVEIGLSNIYGNRPEGIET